MLGASNRQEDLWLQQRELGVGGGQGGRREEDHMRLVRALLGLLRTLAEEWHDVT